MFITLDQYRVTWEFPDNNVAHGNGGTLLVSRQFEEPNDVSRLVTILLNNGARSIKVEYVNKIFEQSVGEDADV